MLKMQICLLFVLLLFVFSGCSKPRNDEVVGVWLDLVDDLVDIERVANLDVPDTRLYACTDPKGGNEDYNHFLSKTGDGEWVIGDFKGPGYLSRVWMTGNEMKKRSLKLYFDNERKPRVDASVDGFFEDGGAFISPLSKNEQGCWNSFVPIPFEKNLRIVTENAGTKPGNWPRLFYQFNCNKLDESEPCPEIPEKLSESDKNLVENVARVWEEKDFDSLLPDGDLITETISLDPKETVACQPITGPAIIRKLDVTLDLSSIPKGVKRASVLREVILKINWNDSPDASVSVPVGDFFGSIWRNRRFNSMFIGMTNDTMFARFPMPFAESATVSFVNEGSSSVGIKVSMLVTRQDEFDSHLGYFHSCWQRSTPRERGKPHTVLQTHGKGKYVGCILAVMNSRNSWWILEGDETIRVDGESMPRWRGTGLEDYFNGGWYYRKVLARPLHGLIRKSEYSTIQYRFHLTDSVVFDSSIDMRFERGPDHASPGWMASTAYYYMDTPAPAASQTGSVVSRATPPDPNAEITVMTQLLSSERLGDFSGACDYIDEFLERHPKYPFAPTLRLRQIRYGEEKSGFESVRKDYENFIAETGDEYARKQAKTLLWFHESKQNLMIGAFCNARTRVFVDGKRVGVVDNPEQLAVIPLKLSPGRHVLALQVTPVRKTPWAQVLIRTHSEDIICNSEWKQTRELAGDDWNTIDCNDSSWKPVTSIYARLPRSPYVKAIPNAFAGMQSKTEGMVDLSTAEKNETTYFRRVFNIQ